MKPRVFISHSSKDNAFVSILIEQLQEMGVETWFDKNELQPGDSIVKGIQDGISDSDYLLLVLSPDSVKSEWVQLEINYAAYKEMEDKGTRVIPLLLKDCEIPTLIADKVYIDFRNSFIEGITRLAEILLIEGGEVKISIRFGKNLGLDKGKIQVHCEASFDDCKVELGQFSLGDLENLLFHKLSTDEVGRIYFNLFEGSLEDDLGFGRKKAYYTTELMVMVNREQRKKQLIAILCREYSRRLCDE